MANCPKCKSSLNWVRLLVLDSYSKIECENCHVKLRIERKRATEIGGLFFILAAIPFIPQLNIDVSYWWIVALVPPFLILWVKFAKFEEIEEPVFFQSNEDNELLENHIRRRKKSNLMLLGIVIVFMTIWLFDAFVLNSQINEFVLIVMLLVMFVCISSMYFISCPFCKKITPYIQNVKTCRYCKKRIK